MIKTNIIAMTAHPQPGIAMPTSARTSAFAGVVSLGDVRAVAKRRLVGTGHVCAYLGTDVFATQGVFPGTSAWSPPI